MRSRNAASKTAINVLRRTSLPCHNKRALTDMTNSTRRHQTTTALKPQMRNIQKERMKQHLRVIMPDVRLTVYKWCDVSFQAFCSLHQS